MNIVKDTRTDIMKALKMDGILVYVLKKKNKYKKAVLRKYRATSN